MRLSTHQAALLIEGVPAVGTLATAAALGREHRSAFRPLPAVVPVDAINARDDRIAPLRDLERFPLPLDRTSVVPGGRRARAVGRRTPDVPALRRRSAG